MTLQSLLKSKVCKKGVDDKKCKTAIDKFIERNKHHTKHHTKHNLKKHHRHKKHTNKPHQTIVNIFNGVAEKTSKAQSTPTPMPSATGQGVPSDVPYSNLVNQRKVFERRFADLEKRKRQTDSHSPFKDKYDAEEGEQDFRPQTTEAGTDPRKAGRPSADELRETKARDINNATDEGTPVYETPNRQQRRDRQNNPQDDIDLAKLRLRKKKGD